MESPWAEILQLDFVAESRRRRKEHAEKCTDFVLRRDIVSSRTRNAQEISILSELLESYIETAESVLFPENYTKMVELITMLSSTMAAFEISPDPGDGMFWRCTQIAEQFHELLGRPTPTVKKLETLYMSASTTHQDLGEMLLEAKELQKEAGRKSQMLQMKANFLSESRRLIRELWSSRGETSLPTRGGNIHVYQNDTQTPPDSPQLGLSLRGYQDLLEDWENLVG